MKRLARMFYGRTQAYGDALDADDPAALAAALARNVRPDLEAWPQAASLAGYAVEAARSLADLPVEAIAAGRLDFPAAAGREAAP